MTDPADAILTNAAVHTLAPGGDETHEAVAVRNGEIVRVDSAYEVGFLEGAETTVIDCEDRVVLPGFVDAHTHLTMVGRREVHADLAGATSPTDAVERLRAELEGDRGVENDWLQGYGYDESDWSDARYLTREDLDRVSEERPVVAFREDLHTASLNSVALARLEGDLPADDVHREDGEPTGVVVESALEPVFDAAEPGVAGTRDLLLAAQRRAHELGVTAVHDMVRRPAVPKAYHRLAGDGDLTLRVRLNYWSDYLDALREVGLRSGFGTDRLEVGAVKTYTDGSIGARTAKLGAPYMDAEGVDGDGTDGSGEGTDEEGDGGDATGRWVVDPEAFEDLLDAVEDGEFQLAAHAIGDAAVDAVLEAYATAGTREARHRVEHAELLPAEGVERFAAAGAVASVQPNFLRWADEGGLYDSRLGEERRRRSNPFAELHEAGVPLAFGSDCMPFGPLYGVHRTVNAPEPAQRLGVTEALRAYTHGAAYAGVDEDRLGTVEPGKRADLVVLERSPWAHPGEIEAIDVALTLVDGEVVYERE